MRYFDNNFKQKADVLIGQRGLKENNIHKVFQMIGKHKGTSRIELSKMASLTPTTISSLVDELIRMELVRETGEKESSTLGRKRKMLEVNPEGRQIPVILFQSRGIAFRLLNLEYRVIESGFTPYPEELMPLKRISQKVEYRITDGDAYVDIIQKLLDDSKLIQRARVDVLGIVMPGTFTWEEERFSSSVLQVKGSTHFIQKLQQQVGGWPILVGNESACFAYEYSCRYNETPENIVFLNIGAGVGAGIIMDDKVFTGDSDLAGEFGHISIDMNGRKCFCGNRGCVERYICQGAILSRIHEAIESGVETGLAEKEKKQELTWDDVCAALREGDPFVQGLMKQVARELVSGISNLACAIDVHRFVLGGGIQKAGEGFLQDVRGMAKEYGFQKAMLKLRFEYAASQPDGACCGIARQFIDKYLTISV